MTRRLGAVLVTLLVVAAGCGGAPRTAPHGPASLGPAYRPVRVPRTLADEEVAEARSTFGAIPVGAPERAPFRKVLLDVDLERVRRALAHHRDEAAFDAFTDCLALWDPVELRGKVDEPRLAEAARAIAHRFARRGAQREVLTALTALLSLTNDEAPVASEIERIHAWLDEATRHEPAGVRSQRLIDDYEAVVQAWPSPAAVDRLRALYRRHQEAMSAGFRGGLRGGGPGLREMLAAHASFLRTGFNLGRLYLRVDQPEQALAALQELANQPGDDEVLRALLAKALGPNAAADDWLAVAKHLSLPASQRGGPNADEERRANLEAALRVCRGAVARFPKEPTGYLCAGEMAFHTGRRGLAIRLFEALETLDPAKREAYEALAVLYYQRFRGRLSEEMLADARGELANLERLHAEAKRRWPDQPLRPPLAASYIELGRGCYNAGRIDEAVKLYERSITAQPFAEAYEQLGLTYLKRGDAARAIPALEHAAALPQPTEPDRLWWEARSLRLIGDAHDLAGRREQAVAAWRKALTVYDRLLRQSGPRDERLPDIWVDRGRLEFSLGRPDEGLKAFDRAIDLGADRPDTYVDVLAFLTPRGHVARVVSIYHRALARPDDEISEYFKVYASFWVLDLLRRHGQPPDGAATAYLEALDGTRWYHELARYVLGRASYEDLRFRADAPGKRAELMFYESMRRLAAGDVRAAEALWRQVVATGMLGYFEYDMAAYYLRHGAPKAPPREGGR